MFRKKGAAAKENAGDGAAPKKKAAPTVSVEDGGSYEGEFNDEGRRHGDGRMRFKSGEVYDGEWVDGQCEG